MMSLPVDVLRAHFERSLVTAARSSGVSEQEARVALVEGLKSVEWVLCEQDDDASGGRDGSLSTVRFEATPERAVSRRARNAIIRPLKWIELALLTVGVVDAYQQAAIVSCLGLLVVLRDLLGCFDVALPEAQSQIVFLLAQAARARQGGLTQRELAAAMLTSFGRQMSDSELAAHVGALERLACVFTADNTVFLADEVVV